MGRVRRTHGTKGELQIESLTDRPEGTFRSGVELRVASADGGEPDPLLPALRIEQVRPYRKGYLVIFEGLTDRDAAALLRGRDLLRPFEEVEPLDADELFHHQIPGLRVFLPDGEELGVVSGLFPMEPIDLLEVRREGRGTVLIPLARAIVVDWDLDEGRITVDPPDGLLDL